MFAPYLNTNPALFFIDAIAVDPRDENSVWALEANGNLYRSTDGGATFSIVLSDPSDQPTTISVSPSGRNIILSGTSANSPAVPIRSSATMAAPPGPAEFHALRLHRLGRSERVFPRHYVGTQNFLTKWSADGTRVIFSTFLDNQETVVASDAVGDTYVAGLALTKFSPGGDLVFTLPLSGLAASAMVMDSSATCSSPRRPSTASEADAGQPMPPSS